MKASTIVVIGGIACVAVGLSCSFLMNDPSPNVGRDDFSNSFQEVRRHTADVLGLPDDDEYTIVVSDEIFHSTNPEFTDLYLYQYSDGEKSSNVLALPADDPRIEYLLTESRSTDPTSLAHTIPTKNLTDNDRELIISKYTQEQRETTRHAIGNFLETNHIAGGFNFDPWTDTFILGLDTTQLNGKTLPTTDIPITTEQATVSRG
ncbi:hypothetical protein [Trueperella sp. LYQ141]|uniref:hypothetical protein n=2 Tax=unclassified Trueperella TaxID=2630174 RepID=UPI003982EA53